MGTTPDPVRKALEQIIAIKNKDWGSDWEEIEEAREIARAALAQPADVDPRIAAMNETYENLLALQQRIEQRDAKMEALAQEAQPTRERLTDDEIRAAWDAHIVPAFGKNGINPIVFARAIERLVRGEGAV